MSEQNYFFPQLPQLDAPSRQQAPIALAFAWVLAVLHDVVPHGL